MLPLLPIFLGSILKFLSTVTINVIHLASVFLPLAIPDKVVYKDTPALSKYPLKCLKIIFLMVSRLSSDLN